jgi:hypothetical protein
MDSLPDDLFLRIMRFNTHPCADIMNGLFQPYRDAMELQQMSSDHHFRTTDYPSFFEWKVHGIGCEQWALLFQAREDFVRKTCLLDRLGSARLDRLITLFKKERAQLQGLEYKF